MTPKISDIKMYPDDRGWFMEGWNASAKDGVWIQDNFSCSKAGVVRGLHCQLGKYAQRKRVTVLRGRIWDVVVNPKTCNWYSYDLSPGVVLTVPRDYLHGFMALEDSMVWYKVDALYNKESECTVRWNDSTLKISWPTAGAIVSDKDNRGMSMDEFLSLIKKS